ncbi:superoxide dismutase [Mn], mitochondrial [Xylona heveae TC161]|uniref:Superoxide dismutase n=1 Tax=Xylona heveae (strain CBS 132557 / TC161) TaxID=1328760 RepID=A0A165ABT8_XYLHT|nr:superoxide dismutase [Mn], mitochondrial [Xylona heveae TC161]KZF20226.1 superoxide dismutase [Mn], mitochondrial [Xylona heveae TC161]
MAASTGPYTLPPLPYAYNALEPVISQQIMDLHHKKHHQTYVNNLNAALASQAKATQSNDISALVSLLQKIKFNGGGHINHSLFWENLTPPDSDASKLETAAPTLHKAIVSRWGSEQAFKDTFSDTLLGLQGSGWGWLVSRGNGGKLDITTTKDQDPVTAPEVPIFGVDMWEHAYYLQYLNNKGGYVSQIWRVINWAVAEERYKHGIDSSKTFKPAM